MNDGARVKEETVVKARAVCRDNKINDCFKI